MIERRAMTVAVTAALIAGVVSLIVGGISAAVTVIVANRRAGIDVKIADAKASVDRDLVALKAAFDQQLTEQKDRLDHKTVFAAELVAHELMMDSDWHWRTFKIIKHHLGGFDDNELRRILVQAGAIRVLSKSGEELWGLLDRNRDSIGIEKLSQDPAYKWKMTRDGSDNVAVQRFDPR
jgi:hypothetical protein